MVETKTVAADVVRRRVDEMAKAIEEQTGRKPGKKERRELKQDAMLDLLPRAFSKLGAVWIWINPATRTLFIDTASQGTSDAVVTALVELLPGFAVRRIITHLAPSAWMGAVLFDLQDEEFSVGRFCELKAQDESKAVVRYNRHSLAIAEIGDHVRAGKVATQLSLTWDGRVSFVLTADMRLLRVTMLESVFEGRDADEDRFDADVAIATGELSRLLGDLISRLGDEVTEKEGAA